jgi:hypothetical protein
MEMHRLAEDILKILPVSFKDCYGASNKRSNGHAKKENTLRAGPNGGRRERSPVARQTAKYYCKRERESVVKEPRPGAGGLQTFAAPAPLQVVAETIHGFRGEEKLPEKRESTSSRKFS